jgi:hypothetical protein
MAALASLPRFPGRPRPSASGEPVTQNDFASDAGTDADPFSVSVTIDSLGGNRSVAGLDFSPIKGSLLNFVQFLVPDTKAGNIVDHVEFRRLSKDENTYSASAKSLPVGKAYAFLMLTGHWERDYAAQAGEDNA